MARKPVTNFGKVHVSTTYNATATSIALTAGQGARLPSTFPFQLVWWNWTGYTDPADDPLVEIVTVTNRVSDTLTVTRGQEGTASSTKNTGTDYYMVLSWTKAMHDDLLTGAPGTVAFFFQAAAPIGWTKSTANNNKALRVVSGTGGGTGGTTPFTGTTTGGSHTLTVAETAAHIHNMVGLGGGSGVTSTGARSVPDTIVSGSTGGGGGHTHPFTYNLQYLDIIACIKD